MDAKVLRGVACASVHNVALEEQHITDVKAHKNLGLRVLTTVREDPQHGPRLDRHKDSVSEGNQAVSLLRSMSIWGSIRKD